MDPDPGGPQTFGSDCSGSATLTETLTREGPGNGWNICNGLFKGGVMKNPAKITYSWPGRGCEHSGGRGGGWSRPRARVPAGRVRHHSAAAGGLVPAGLAGQSYPGGYQVHMQNNEIKPRKRKTTGIQCCGTVTIYYGSGSEFWQVTVQVPDTDHKKQFPKQNCVKNLAFLILIEAAFLHFIMVLVPIGQNGSYDSGSATQR